jgi:hypothetical protein
MLACRSVSGRWGCVVVLLLVWASACPVSGEIISYTNGAAAVFGTPETIGDTLWYDPTVFVSRCSGADGVDMVDGLLRVWISASAAIDTVTVEEGGAWFFFGPSNDATQAYVGVHGAELVITEVNGAALVGCPPIMIPGTMVFTPSSSEVGARTFVATEPVNRAGWQGTMVFDNVGAALAGTPYEGGHVTGATLIFDDILATASTKGTIASIDKKWISVTTTPEPAAIALLAAASTLGLAYHLRNRRRAQ